MKLNNKQLTTEIVIKALNNYKHAGYNDWRLPTVPELLTLYGSVVFKGCNRSPFHKLMESDVWVSDYSEYGHHDYSFYDDELDRFESGRYFINFSKNGFIHNSIELNMRKSFILPVRSYIPLEITPNVINLPRIVIPEIGYEMVYISPGTYVTKRGGTENKDVTITITKGFFIGTHPVTVRQWKSICDYLPTEYICGYKPDEYKNIYDPEQHRYYEFLTDDSPIICSCYEAHTFLDNLKKALEKEYAIGPFLLPTEAEWEFACRAGSDTNYCYGDNDDYLPYYGWNYMDDLSCNEAIIHPVGALLPNNWGLYDMHGNIPEFTRDIVLHSEVCQRSDHNILIDPKYPPRNHIIDSSDNTGDGYEYHVIAKGGGWSDPPAKCRSYEYDLLGVYSWSAESIAFRFIIYGTPEQFFHYSKKGYESAT